MHTAVHTVASNMLSDGRRTRQLRERNQAQLFFLRQGGALLMNERLIDIPDHNDSLSRGHHPTVDAARWWRTRLYGVYKRGFERADLSIGRRITWLEKIGGHLVDYHFVVPDIKHPLLDKGLQEARGLVVFDLDDLVFDPATRIVSPKPSISFDNVLIMDITHPKSCAIVDANGFPLKAETKSSEGRPNEAISYTNAADDFLGSADGWHGSIGVRLYVLDHILRRIIWACDNWSTLSNLVAVEKPH